MKTTLNNNMFTIDTLNSRVGINLGGNNLPTLSGTEPGVEMSGALRISGTSGIDSYRTPLNVGVAAKINIVNQSLPNFGQIMAMGLTSSSDATSRALSLFDARTVRHQPTLAVFNPDENASIGFSWNGSSATASLQTSDSDNSNTKNIILQSGNVTAGNNNSGDVQVNTGTVAGSGTSSGTLYVVSGDGVGTNTSSGNVIIDVGVNTGAGTRGNVNIGVTNGLSVNIGRTAGTTTLQGGTTNVTGTLNANGDVALGDAATDLITMAGTIQGGSPFVFEGATADANELTLSVASLTADRTITLPDETGTVCLQNSANCGFLTGATTDYIQNGTTVQTANYAIRSSAIGNVGAVIQGANGQTADLFRVQTWNGSLATTVFGVGNTGNITATGTYNTNTFTGGALTFGSAATISAAASTALDITSNAASTWSTTSGNLSIQAQGNLNLGNAGGQTINLGTDNKAHTITIGNQSTTGAQSVTIGSNGNTGSSVSLESGATGAINIGNAATAHTVNIATGAATQTVNIGSTNGTSTTTISGGSGGVNINGATSVAGQLSATSFTGAGLTDCDSINSKLLWDTTTKTFSCGTDKPNVINRKSTVETSNSLTYVSDVNNSFRFTVAAGEIWAYQINTNFNTNDTTTTNASDTNPEIRMLMSSTTGATCRHEINNLYMVQNITSTSCTSPIGEPDHAGDTTDQQYLMWGTIVGGSSSSTVTLEFRRASGGTGTITHTAGGFMTAYKLSGVDLAEAYYTNDNSVGPGDVVSVDGDTSLKAGVKKTSGAYDATALGIVSTQPGMVLGDPNAISSGGKPVLLALSGRIPVKVSLENGPINPGDYLTTSSTPGVAMKATQPGQMIGKALEGFNSANPSARGVVMTFANLTYADPNTGVTANNDLQNGTFSDLNIDGTLTTKNLKVTGKADIHELVVGTMSTNSLKVRGSMAVSGDINLDGVGKSRNAITKKFVASKHIPIGSVVIVDPVNDGQVTSTTVMGDTRVLGVALTEADAGEEVTVAIGGSVQVMSANATMIQGGDLMVSSGQEGMAEKSVAPQPGSMVGKALGKSDDGQLVWILVSLH